MGWEGRGDTRLDTRVTPAPGSGAERWAGPHLRTIILRAILVDVRLMMGSDEEGWLCMWVRYVQRYILVCGR